MWNEDIRIIFIKPLPLRNIYPGLHRIEIVQKRFSSQDGSHKYDMWIRVGTDAFYSIVDF